MRLEQTLVGQQARRAAEYQQHCGRGFGRRIIQQLDSLQLIVSPRWPNECIATVRVRG
jgi:hypothetical protein